MSCAGSGPTLPSLLRSIYTTEFSSSRRLPPSLRPHSPLLSPSCHRFNPNRYFSSSPRGYSQSEESSPPQNVRSPNKDTRAKVSPSPSKDTKTKKQSQSGRNTKRSNPKTDGTMPPKKKPEGWQIQKESLNEKFPEGWNPRKKLSPDAVDGIRQLHGVAPAQFTTPVLAEKFKVSPEVIRRILKSKWRPTEEEAEARQDRWQRRHHRIWSQMTELGLRPPKKSVKEVSDSKVLYDDDQKRPI